MLNDLASCYDVDLIYFKYDWENDYVPERGNVNTKLTIRNSIMTKLKIFATFLLFILLFLYVLIG